MLLSGSGSNCPGCLWMGVGSIVLYCILGCLIVLIYIYGVFK